MYNISVEHNKIISDRLYKLLANILAVNFIYEDFEQTLKKIFEDDKIFERSINHTNSLYNLNKVFGDEEEKEFTTYKITRTIEWYSNMKLDNTTEETIDPFEEKEDIIYGKPEKNPFKNISHNNIYSSGMINCNHWDMAKWKGVIYLGDLENKSFIKIGFLFKNKEGAKRVFQDLIDKEKTQNTFFHIFSHLHLNNKQIIISSDCSPSMLKGMPERLLTRMKWGMTVELERPDMNLRRSVLTRIAEHEGLPVSDELIEFIATNVTGSIRELEGIMVSLVTRATILNRPIDHDLTRTVISNSVKINKKQINFEMVTQSVSAHYNIEPDAIFTKSRKREVSDARQMVMYMAKKHAKMALTAIGTRLSRTHATVLYACKSIEDRLAYEKQLQEDVASIERDFIKG